MLAYDPCMSGWAFGMVGWLGGWVGWLHFAQRSRDNKRRKFKAKLIF